MTLTLDLQTSFKLTVHPLIIDTVYGGSNQLPYAVRHPPIWKYVKHYIGNRNIVEVSSFFIDKIYVRYPDFINGFVVKFKDGNPTRVVRKTDISPSLTQKEAHGKILKLKAYCFMIPMP